MVDSLKITSPVAAKSKIQNFQKHPMTDAIFDLLNTEPTEKTASEALNHAKDSSRQSMVMDTGKMILQPLLSLTGAQAQQCMELLSLLRLYLPSSEGAPDTLLEHFFVPSENLLEELTKLAQDRTSFKGGPFDLLQMISEQSDQPELKDAITAVLKHFDCRLNRESSLNAILTLSSRFIQLMPTAGTDTKSVEQLGKKLDQLVQRSQDPKEILSFIKKEVLPVLVQTVKQHPENRPLRDTVMEMIHYIVRFESGDPERLEEALTRLDELMKASDLLKDVDTDEVRSLLVQRADEGPEELKDKAKLLSLLSKTLDDTVPTKMNKAAQNLLMQLVQNENPILPYGRFVVPIRCGEENTIGEFIVDKDCEERKGEAKRAVNIFFTIQSDRYGFFEVDLLARDRLIDLDMKCPEFLVGPLKVLKHQIKGIMEAEGYRLADYQVAVYREGRPLLERYPKLEWRKMGIDVKI